MTVSRRAILAGLAPAGVVLTSPLHAEGIIDDLIGAKDDFIAASDAYVYGYPLVTMEITRRVMTNVATAEALRAPMGQFIRARSYPDADFYSTTSTTYIYYRRLRFFERPLIYVVCCDLPPHPSRSLAMYTLSFVGSLSMLFKLFLTISSVSLFVALCLFRPFNVISRFILSLLVF